MNRVLSSVALALLAASFWTGCGGSSSKSSSNTKPLTNIQHRLFVSNAGQGIVQIIDVDKDQLAGWDTGKVGTYNIPVGSSPEMMDSTSDNRNIAVYGAGNNSVSVINSDIENVTGSAYLSGASQSIRMTSDAKFVYAAVRNLNNGSGVAPGGVQVVDIANSNVKASYPVPNARWIALSPDNKTLLAFPDDGSNTPYLIDLSATSPSAVRITGTFDRPIAAYFSSDSSKAYVLNCGWECGGAQTSVVQLTISGLTEGTPVPVPGATVGVLDGSTLYVAGQSPSGGVLSVVDTGAMTVSSSTAIGNGFHGVMRSAGSKVWVGATSCGGGGCLSIFDPASGKATVDNPAPGATTKGDVTGMDFETSNNRMYICEGGELSPYDTSGNPVHTNVDIVGTAWDVRAVPPITKK